MPGLNGPRTILAAISALVLAGIACAAFTGSEPRPAEVASPTQVQQIEPASARIAYRSRSGNLMLIDADGSNQIAVTDDAFVSPGSGELRFYPHFAWSPNGAQLAFGMIENLNDSPAVNRVLVAGPDFGQNRTLFESEDDSLIYLYWSPDNYSISFLTNDFLSPELSLRVAFSDGAAARVVDRGQPYYWNWSPDGSSILIHAGGSAALNPRARLSLLNLPDFNESRTDLPPAPFQAPAWSPDGSQLLLAVQDENNTSQIVITDLDGNITDRLADYLGSAAFSWSPDGSLIAYLADADPGGALQSSLNITSPSMSEPISTRQDSVVAYFWAPDSRKIAYLAIDDNQDIEVSLDRPQAQASLQLSLSVLDIESGASRQLAVFEPTDGFLSVLPFFDQYHHSATIWSPDSSMLVYTARDIDGVGGLWIAPVEPGQTPRFLATGELAFWSPGQ